MLYSIIKQWKLLDVYHPLEMDNPDVSILDLLKYSRQIYITSHINQTVKHVLHRAGINTDMISNLPVEGKVYIKEDNNNNIDWGDWRFHLNNRLHLNNKSSDTDFDLLFSLVPSAKHNEQRLKQIIKEGVENGANSNGVREKRYYDLSILPLNLVLGEKVVNYFIPPADYLLPHPTKKPDPYGLIHGKTRAKVGKDQPTPITEKTSHLLLGAHKFSHTLLFNVDFYCPVGCADCYKTRMGTREYLDPEQAKSGHTMKIYNHPDLGVLNPPTKDQVAFQARSTVKWMNEDPRGQQVRDVIISGGEPLWLPNENIKAILEEFQNAKNLKILRICTGAIFLGAPFRVDDSLLDMLKDFSDSTGVRITFQAHIGNYHMISPEAVIAVQKIRQWGIPIYSQVPIKNGVNFFLDDPERTINELVELGRRQVIVGVEPYMFIVDMHPSTNAYYVPIEPLMQTWGTLVESHDYPGLERPRTMSVLFSGGNIVLSGHILFSAMKEIDKDNDKVIYKIPRVTSGTGWKTNVAEFFEFEEPLLKGINDDPESLDKIKTHWFGSQHI